MYENPFEEKLLVIAEKPSVARMIAASLGCHDQKDGYIDGADYVVSWCFGHLAEYAMPDAYDEKYRKWSMETLPIIPENWKLEVSKEKEKQFRLLCDLLNNRLNGKKFFVPVSGVVNACDAGREGELIFKRVYDLSGSTLPVRRLWISSMEDEAIVQGFLNLRSASEYANLAAASECRAQADWLVGMNASRAFTKAYDHRFSIGRVQTPTLAMLVDREEQINTFQKKQFYLAHLLVSSRGNTINAVSERFTDREEVNRIAGTCDGRTATVPSIKRKTKVVPPPRLYDLTTLQRDANRLFSLTAANTLKCAQRLYENKLITYPRTDSNYLTDDMTDTASGVLKICMDVFPFLAGAGGGASSAPEISRLLDSRKVTDHHAIIPTVMLGKADLSILSAEEKKILTLIAARLASATGQKHVYESVRATFLCCGCSFTASGKTVREMGWKATEEAIRSYFGVGQAPASSRDSMASDQGDTDLPDSTLAAEKRNQDLSSLYQGAQFSPVSTKVTEHWTQPPAPFTEDALLLSMEHAGAEEMQNDVERKGLGTPATRAGIIEKLVSSGYVIRKKRQLIPTEAGQQLISVVPEYMKSAKMTADWENQLLMMERGQYDRKAFMDGITQMILRIVRGCRQLPEEERKKFGGHGVDRNNPGRESLGKCPVCGSPVYEGERFFHCADRTCRFVLWKENRYLSKMRTCLDEGMVKDLLSAGRTTVKGLYSSKKDKFFSADLLFEWKDGKAVYRLDFIK